MQPWVALRLDAAQLKLMHTCVHLHHVPTRVVVDILAHKLRGLQLWWALASDHFSCFCDMAENARMYEVKSLKIVRELLENAVLDTDWMNELDEQIWDGMKTLFWAWSNYLASHVLTFLFQKDQKMNGGPSKRLLRRQAHPWGAFAPRCWSRVSFGGLEGENLVVVEQLIHFVESCTCMGLYLEVAHPAPVMHSKGQKYMTICQYKQLVHRRYTQFCWGSDLHGPVPGRCPPLPCKAQQGSKIYNYMSK